MERLFKVFKEAGHELYLVGGAVRDLAMGATYAQLDDLDFCTDARPRRTLELMRAAKFKTYDVGIDFGTVGAILRGPGGEGYPKDVQVTTYRSNEKYRRGSRHPVVSYGDSIEEDLWRRDFSINSIAMDADGTYLDPYDGRGDIERRTLRAVGDPIERLAEDPLRILRIARFMAKLGFEPNGGLEEAACIKATFLLEIARQRWLQEMTKLLIGPSAPSALDFLARTGALGIILPEVLGLVDLHLRSPNGPVHPDFWSLTKARVARAGTDKNMSWAALLADVGRPWTRRPSPSAAGFSGPVLAGIDKSAFPAEAVSGAAATFHNHAIQSGLLAKGIGRRFHFDTASCDAISYLLAHQRVALTYETGWTNPMLRGFVKDMQGHHTEVLAFGRLLQSASEERAGEADLESMGARLRALEVQGRLLPELPKGMGGAIMKHFSLKPGPGLGALVDWLKDEMLEDRVPFGLEVDGYLRYLEEVRPAPLDG
jgi:poly(A) polymerase